MRWWPGLLIGIGDFGEQTAQELRTRSSTLINLKQ